MKPLKTVKSFCRMMPTLHFIGKTLALNLALFFFLSCKWIYADPALVRYHIEYAQTLVEEGQEETAIEHLVKALLFETTEPTAKSHLKNMVDLSEEISDPLKTKICRFLDLIDYANFLRSRQQYLLSNNMMMIDFILDHEDPDADLFGMANEKKQQLSEYAQDLDAGFERLSDSGGLDVIDLGKINDDLLALNDRQTNNLNKLQAINEILRAGKRQTVYHIAQKRDENLADGVGKQLTDIRQQLSDKNTILQQQEETLDTFQQQMKTVQLKFEIVQTRLADTDQKIHDLTAELAGMSLEVYEKDKMLTDREQQVSELKNQLTETKERLSLVQRIIHEKDQHIQELEQEVLNIQTRMQTGSIEPEGMAKMKDDLQHLQDAVKAQSVARTQQMEDLEQEMKSLREQYLALESRIKEREEAIVQLRQTVASKDKKILNYQQAFSEKTQKVSQLNGIVQIYKERLSDTHFVLKEKDKQLKELEETLMELEKQLSRGRPNPQPGSSSSPLTNARQLAEDQHLYFLTTETILENMKEAVDAFSTF